MKKKNIIILITIIILILILVGSLIYYQIYNPKQSCNYNSEIKSYIGKSAEECKLILFKCIQGTKPFTDECGCGCEIINTNNQTEQKIYCTPEQKKAEVCPEYYSATCGWFNQSIQCIKYPCAQTFSNPCFACASENVEYYTESECPK